MLIILESIIINLKPFRIKIGYNNACYVIMLGPSRQYIPNTPYRVILYFISFKHQFSL